MKLRKISVILTMVLVAVMVVLFAVGRVFFVDPVEDTLKNLEERYNQKFTYIQLEIDMSTLDSRRYIFCDDKGNKVNIDRIIEGDLVYFRDDYMMNSYSDSMKSILLEGLQGYAEDIEWDRETTIFPVNTTINSDYSDFSKDSKSIVGIKFSSNRVVSDDDIGYICRRFYTLYNLKITVSCEDPQSMVYFTSGDGGSVISIDRESILGEE